MNSLKHNILSLKGYMDIKFTKYALRFRTTNGLGKASKQIDFKIIDPEKSTFK